MEDIKRIVLTGGGTAGHCIPHLAILPHIKNYFDEVYYIGSCNGMERGIIEKQIPYYSVSCAKLNRSFTFKNLLIPFKLIKGVNEAKKILKELKPKVVFSKGGYVALPVVMAAKKLKIPVILHESDLTIGLANKLSLKYADKVLTTFKETANGLKNGLYVGAPIRDELFTADRPIALKRFNLDGKKPVLLVLGGSLGSVKINDALRLSLNKLLKDFDVLHICGRNNVISSYKQNGYVQLDYVTDMNNAYKVADVCVSRAGANSAFELLSLKIPTLFIPLPKGASRGDQILNAEYFYKKGLCNLLYQEDLTEKSMYNEVLKTYSKRFEIKTALNNEKIKNADATISNVLKSYTT